jgi:Na+:H+ antiporter, NhaC family
MADQYPIRTPALYKALIPVVFLIVLLSFNVLYVFGDNAISGSNQMILLMSAAVAALVGWTDRISWRQMMAGVERSITSTVPAIIILLLIGALAGTWLLSGVVPAMIYYGLQILHPSIFLVATCLICSLVSVATGSSWSTVATVGIALLGIGKTMGFSEPLIAGAIISGAYFGDKISPLSDTTNLASAMAGTELITHIKYLLLTTTPSIVIALIIFAVLGIDSSSTYNQDQINIVMSQVKDTFYISPILFLVPALVIFLIVLRVPAIPALFIGMLAGALFALVFQSHIIFELIPNQTSSLIRSYEAIMNSMTVNVQIPSDNPLLAELFSSKGMQGMLGTIWLVLAAMVFGGIMEACGFLKSMANSLIKLAKSTASLITTTAATCLSVNILASDQYLAIVIPGKMYEKIYRQKGLKPENLSRTLEDAGTVTSPLIPWNTCGAYHAGVLGVATGAYLPYCFFNLISPVMTIIFAVFNIKIRKYSASEMEEFEQEEIIVHRN